MLKIVISEINYSDVQAALYEAAKQEIQNKLEHLSEEMNREGGSLAVSFSGDSMIVNTDEFSPDLQRRIEEALN